MEPMLQGAAPQAAPADLIKDSDQTKFAKDVLEASRTTPVIVDFWAPWCGPCKTLQPMIEKVVKEAKGAVKLVKINIDQNQMLAQQLRIQSIPAVYAFFGGRPVDGFMGAVPETPDQGIRRPAGAGSRRRAGRRRRRSQRGAGACQAGGRREGFRPRRPDLQRGARGRAGQPAGDDRARPLLRRGRRCRAGQGRDRPRAGQGQEQRRDRRRSWPSSTSPSRPRRPARSPS